MNQDITQTGGNAPWNIRMLFLQIVGYLVCRLTKNFKISCNSGLFLFGILIYAVIDSRKLDDFIAGVNHVLKAIEIGIHSNTISCLT